MQCTEQQRPAAVNYTIDTKSGVIAVQQDGDVANIPLYSTRGFELLSELWVKVGWNEKHSYTFTWMGIPGGADAGGPHPHSGAHPPPAAGGDRRVRRRPRRRPHLLCLALQDNGPRPRHRHRHRDPPNRAAIEGHPLFEYVTLIEGSSVDETIVAQVEEEIGSAQDVRLSRSS